MQEKYERCSDSRFRKNNLLKGRWGRANGWRGSAGWWGWGLDLWWAGSRVHTSWTSYCFKYMCIRTNTCEKYTLLRLFPSIVQGDLDHLEQDGLNSALFYWGIYHYINPAHYMANVDRNHASSGWKAYIIRSKADQQGKGWKEGGSDGLWCSWTTFHRCRRDLMLEGWLTCSERGPPSSSLEGRGSDF